ncbi:MAG: GntR family transcriptional regulator [Oscillospiraceae bacterium]
MSWQFTGDRTIYSQLVEQLQLRIVTGVYPPGGKIQPVRELAAEAAVNPNTMQRALAELERQELVYAQRTAGRFVTEDPERIAALRQSMALEKARAFYREMESLGFSQEETLAFLSHAERAAEEKKEETEHE